MEAANGTPEGTPPPPLLVLLAEHASERRIAGVGSTERILRTAAAAGVETALVLTSEAQTQTAVRGIGVMNDVRVTPAASDGARRALAALAAADRPFLFAHTELVLDPGYLGRLLARGDGEVVVIGVERGRGSSHPLTPGVRLAGDRVLEIAADAAHHAVGAALLPADAARELVGDPLAMSTRLGARLAAWAEADRLIAFDGGPGLGRAAFSDADLREAERALLRTTGKPSDGMVSRHLNRPVSRIVTSALLDLPITPNVVTLVTVALSLLTLWILARGDQLGFVLGTLLYHLNSVLDGVDGELARLRFQSTPTGAWLDTIADSVTNLLFVAGIALGTWRVSDGSAVPLWVGGFTLLGFVVTPLLVYRRAGRARDEGRLDDFGRSLVAGMQAGSTKARLASFVTQIARRDAYALLFFLLALAGLERSVLWILAVGVLGHLLALLLPKRGAA